MKIIVAEIKTNNTKLVLINLKSNSVENKLAFSIKSDVSQKEHETLIEIKIKDFLDQISFVKNQNIIENVVFVSNIVSLNNIFQNILEKLTNKKVMVLTSEMTKIENYFNWNQESMMLVAGAMTMHSSFIVVNLETLTVFNTVENSKPKGMVIAPGLELSKKSLIQNAALIKNFKGYYFDDVLTTDTEKTVSAGLILSQTGMIEYIVNQTQKKLKKSLPILITGNNFNYLKKNLSLKFVHQFEPNLSLIGIADTYKYFNKK